MIIFLLFSCKDSPSSEPEHCDEEYINYHTVAQPFLRTYCTSCHSEQLSGPSRYGAPGNINLDTLKDARNWAQRIRARSIDSNTMPPSGGIRDEEKALLEKWLECGTPGEEQEVLNVEVTQDNFDSHVVLAMVTIEPDNPEVFRVTREVNSGGSDDERLGLWSYEYYRLTPDEAWFLGYDIFDTPTHISRSVRFSPQLPILLREPDWTATVTATIETDEGTVTETQSWTGSSNYVGIEDGHERDPNPLNIVVSSENEEWRWHTSSTLSVTAQWVSLPDGSGWESLQFMGGNGLPVEELFGINTQTLWGEKMIAWEGE